MANTILPGYETPMGAKKLVIFDHFGPASYTQSNSASTGPVTSGGDVINAADLNEGGFDSFEADMTDSTGQLYAYVQLIGGGNGNAVKSVRLIWYSRVTATVGGQAQTAGTQVVASTNLSTIALRCKAWAV